MDRNEYTSILRTEFDVAGLLTKSSQLVGLNILSIQGKENTTHPFVEDRGVLGVSNKRPSNQHVQNRL